MKSKIEHWPLLSFKEYEKDINPKPKYQRSSVWKPEQRNMLIDSILRQIDIPKIYLRELNNNDQYSYEIIDGKQRMSTIWDFLKNVFPLNETSEELTIGNNKYDVSECTYSELDTKVKIERIHKYSLDVVIVYDATEDEIADLFYRLNNGTPLSPSEVRNSMPGVMGDTIRNLSKHSFFTKVSFNKGRYVYDQVAAQMMLLEISEGIADTRDRSLSKMYGDYTKSVPLKPMLSNGVPVEASGPAPSRVPITIRPNWPAWPLSVTAERTEKGSAGAEDQLAKPFQCTKRARTMSTEPPDALLPL